MVKRVRSSAKTAGKRKSQGWSSTATSEDTPEPTARKAAIVVLISLAHEAEDRSGEELTTEIQEALEEGLAKIPWLALENVVIVEE